MTAFRWQYAAAVILIGVVSGPLAAQREVVLKDGAVIKGRVLEDDGKKVVIQLELGAEGSGKATYTYDELSPASVYRIKLARTSRDDAKEQLALATYAFDNGQWDDARLSFILAENADKKQGGTLKPQLVGLVEKAAPVAMKMAQADAKAGRVLAAERRLSRILEHLPESPEAEQARKMLQDIQKQAMEAREKRRLALAQTEQREEAKEMMAPVRARYEAAHAMVRDALNNTRKQSAAIQGFRDAIANFEGVRRDLAQIAKDQGQKSDFAKQYESWDKSVLNDIVETRLHLASLYFVRSSLMDAQNEVNAALALDPESSDALAMRGRLEVASSEGGKWKW